MRVAPLFLLVCAGLITASSTSLAQETESDEVDLELEGQSGTTIVIKAARPADKLGQTRIDAKQAEEVAGVQGDALKAVSVEASVARTSGSAAGVSVWGAAPADTRIYVDEVPVPRFFHMGGTRSILPSPEVESFTLISGGAPARFGRGIGGAIEVRTPEPSLQPIRMHLRVDPIDVGGGFGARFGQRASLSFAGRSSVLPLGFKALASERAEQVYAVPDYSDFQSRLSYKLQDGQELRVLALLSVDELGRGIPGRIDAERFTEARSAGFGRLAVRLLRGANSNGRQVTLWVGRDAEKTRQDFGAVFAQERLRKDALGALLVRNTRLSDHVQLALGLDSELSRSRWTRDGAVALPAREGDLSVFGQAPGDRVNEDDWTVTMASVALFSTMTFRLGPSLRLEPGLRLEPSIVNGNRVLPVRATEPEVGYSKLQWSLSPRARISYHASEALSLYTSGGRYSQAPATTDLSPVFGSPVLERANAWQLLLGSELRLADHVQLGAQGFVTRQSKLAVRAADATPALASLLSSSGEGRTRGALISARAKFGNGIAAAAHYTLMKAERRTPGAGRWRLFDFDQRHTLRSTVQWKSETGVALAARAELTSGFPRTPVEGSVFNASSQRFDPIFGAQNTERLPVFAELSLRVGYQDRLGWGTYRVWLDVVNATNRHNAQERFYSANYMRSSYVRGLPLLPLLGAELQL